MQRQVSRTKRARIRVILARHDVGGGRQEGRQLDSPKLHDAELTSVIREDPINFGTRTNRFAGCSVVVGGMSGGWYFVST